MMLDVTSYLVASVTEHNVQQTDIQNSPRDTHVDDQRA